MKSGEVFVGILLGAPGSGKGTQGATLSELYRVPSISTGDLLRSEISSGSALGQHVRAVIASGALVGDELVNEMVASRISQEDCAAGFLLDGYPRSRSQAEFLDRLLGELGLPDPSVIHLDVPMELLRTRMLGRRQCPVCKRILSVLSGGLGGMKVAEGICPYDGARIITRPDDRQAAVEARLAGYESYEREVVAFYRGRNYHRIDGAASMQSVTAQVLEALTTVMVPAA